MMDLKSTLSSSTVARGNGAHRAMRPGLGNNLSPTLHGKTRRRIFSPAALFRLGPARGAQPQRCRAGAHRARGFGPPRGPAFSGGMKAETRGYAAPDPCPETADSG